MNLCRLKMCLKSGIWNPESGIGNLAFPKDERSCPRTARKHRRGGGGNRRASGARSRSTELTAAAGLLAAAVFLGAWGGALGRGFVALIRAPLTCAVPPVTADPVEVVAQVRAVAGAVLGPVLGLLGGVAVTMLVAHQVQVGGLWVPGLLVPDPARLWTGGIVGDPLARLGRAVWAAAKTVAVVALTTWFLHRDLPRIAPFALLEPAEMAGAAAGTVLELVRRWRS